MMLVEHNTLRKYVKGMSKAVAEYKAGNRKVLPNMIENIRFYIKLMTENIKIEENDLFPRADIHLSEEKRKELLDEFEKVDRFGVGKQEEFRKLLNLKRIYLE